MRAGPLGERAVGRARARGAVARGRTRHHHRASKRAPGAVRAAPAPRQDRHASGIYLHRLGLQRAEDALREADVALSVAKRQQNQLTVAYTPGMGGAAVSLVSLEADLHIALERHEFRLLFQPILDLRGQRAVGATALIRWRRTVEGLT